MLDSKKLFNLNVWNIGFVDKPVAYFMENDYDIPDVKWLKHPYKDRFFADPFLLSVSDDKIEVLVEEFLFSQKIGKISKLIIDKDYNLVEKKIVDEQSFHQSYPFVIKSDNQTIVVPEASKSGGLYKYQYDFEMNTLIKPELLVSEPLLDSTLLFYNSYWWLFAHKRGREEKNNLYLFYAKSLNDTFRPHNGNPVKLGDPFSRPAGNIVLLKNQLYRVTQVCENSYGEAVRIFRIETLNPNEFEEIFIKEIRLNDQVYNKGFHTLNGMNNLTVVDGLQCRFTPFRRLSYEIMYKLKQNKNHLFLRPER
jgi:hypothetical protein